MHNQQSDNPRKPVNYKVQSQTVSSFNSFAPGRRLVYFSPFSDPILPTRQLGHSTRPPNFFAPGRRLVYFLPFSDPILPTRQLGHSTRPSNFFAPG
jgi:hypothetical protein